MDIPAAFMSSRIFFIQVLIGKYVVGHGICIFSSIIKYSQSICSLYGSFAESEE